MKKIFLLLLFVVFIGANTAHAKQQAMCNDHKEFVKSVSSDLIDIVEDKNLSDMQKEKKLEKKFNQFVDIDWISKFALGKHYRKLDAEQKKEYKKAYRDYMVATYIPKFRQYSGEQVEIVNSKPLKAHDSYLVATKLTSPKSEDIPVSYRVAKRGVCYQLQDIIAEGVSMLNTQRQDFGSVISRKGFDGLLELLRSKSS